MPSAWLIIVYLTGFEYYDLTRARSDMIICQRVSGRVSAIGRGPRYIRPGSGLAALEQVKLSLS